MAMESNSSSPALAIQMFADAVGVGVQMGSVQFDGAPGEQSNDVHALAGYGLSGSSGAVPHADAIQKSFGHHDVSGVQSHVGGRAAEASNAMGAHAYASGNQVAFAKSPDLHLAAHELAHVVQQRGGVRLAGGVGREGDEYERHADQVADLVVQGKSAQGLLDTMAHRGASGGSALQHFSSHVPATSNPRLIPAIRRATSQQATTIANQLVAGLRTHAPTIALHFEAGEEHFDLVVSRQAATDAIRVAQMQEMTATGEEMCEAPPETAATPSTASHSSAAPAHGSVAGAAPTHASAARTRPPVEISSGGYLLRQGITAAIAALAGPEGTEQQLELRINVPVPAFGPLARLSGALTLRLAHERMGTAHGEEHAEPSTYQVAAHLQLGGGIDVGIFEARLMAGLSVEAHGVDPSHAATMVLFALEHRIRAANNQTAEFLFGEGFDATALRRMSRGDSADIAGTVAIEAGIHSPEGTPESGIEASAGLSHHYVTEQGEHGAEELEYTMFDASAELAVTSPGGVGLGGHIEAHLPVGAGAHQAEPEIEIAVRGHVHATEASRNIFSALTTLVGLVITQLEHSPDDSSSSVARLRRFMRSGAQALSNETANQFVHGELSAVAGASEAAAAESHGHGESGGTIGMELALMIEGDHISVSLRAIEEQHIEVAHIGEVTYERMTILPLRVPPGLLGEAAPAHAPAAHASAPPPAHHR
jgi:hypothetical protein